MILDFDAQIFELINVGLSNKILDYWLIPWRHELFWTPLYLFIVAFLFMNYGRKAYWFLLFFIITISISDLSSSHLIKKNIKRDRPCRNEMVENHIARVRCGSGYSFTSSHATNHFAMATFLFFTLGSVFKKYRWILFLWAGSISFAQVYVGVHFPLDIIAGGILGYIIGKLSYIFYQNNYGYLIFDS
jgi:membrane-associated phospholipid phosphatase